MRGHRMPEAAMSDQSPVSRLLCRCCGLPVLRGQPHWAGDREGHPWHYECAETSGLTIPWRPRAAGEPHPVGRDLQPVAAGG